MKKLTFIALAGGISVAVATGVVSKESGTATKIPNISKFDFYILATQWIPGWCEVGTGQSGASLDLMKACQQQASSPLMFHGLWPENNNGTYPSDCAKVPDIDTSKLDFSNPYLSYLSNASAFINHEWSKHGTCSNFYDSGSETAKQNAYYQNLNKYFQTGIKQYQQIKLPTFMLQMSVKDVQQQIHKLNQHIPADSIMVMCDSNNNDERYMTGLWFCSNKTADKFISCPESVSKNACSGNILTR